MSNLLEKLNPMQKQAVITTEGPLLLLAGAGSGKTRVITHRIAYLIECGVDPFNIMAITFTNKAAREMKERVELTCNQGNNVWISTFHSTCVRILRREIEILGYTSRFTIYDSDDSEKLLRDIFKDFNINTTYFNPKWVMSVISSKKNELITPEEFAIEVGLTNDFRLKTASTIYTEYQKRLKQNNSLDFDDLIFKTVQIFSENEYILDKYANRFKYIMVDEYQDTNISQYKLIMLLSSKYKNLCVVGDDDQSIYGWRGANIRNILDFEKDFKNTKTIKLEQNYRSTSTILNAANNVIKNNISRKDKKLWTENESGSPIHSYNALNERDEALFISSEIRRAIKKGAQYKDFAVLYRNNSLSRVIEDEFVKNSVPYRIFGGVPFYSRKEIKDTMSYLRFLYNPTDEISLKRIINVPKRGIGDTTIEKLVKYAVDEEISLFEAMINSNNIPELKSRSKKILEFVELMNNFRNQVDKLDIHTIIKNIAEDTGYEAELLKEGTEEAINRIDNINELISKAVEFEKESENPTLASFLEEVALVAEIDNYSESDDAVVLMTLHSSKGLEFPTVFIVGFEEGIFPGYRAMMDPNPNALEEERRLCYVGITRAKRILYLTCSDERFQHGEYRHNAPSRFLKEIPRKYIYDTMTQEQNNKIITDNKFNTNNQKKKYNLSSAISYSTTYNKIPEPNNKTLDFKVGDTVKHLKYGKGEILSIKPAGADYEATVEFTYCGIQKVMIFLSKLKKV